MTAMNRARRILVAAVVAAVGVAAGIALVAVLRSGGDLGQPLTPGRPAAVALHPSTARMVWSTSRTQTWCDIGGEGQPVSTSMENTLLSGDYRLDARGERWYGVLALRADPAGTYEVSCGSSPGMAIGDPPRAYTWRDRGLGIPLGSTVVTTLIVLPFVLTAWVVIRPVLSAVNRRRRPSGPV
jgi:hypothetical protein